LAFLSHASLDTRGPTGRDAISGRRAKDAPNPILDLAKVQLDPGDLFVHMPFVHESFPRLVFRTPPAAARRTPHAARRTPHAARRTPHAARRTPHAARRTADFRARGPESRKLAKQRDSKGYNKHNKSNENDED